MVYTRTTWTPTVEVTSARMNNLETGTTNNDIAIANVAAAQSALTSGTGVLNRANHTGVQAESTVTNLVNDLAAAKDRANHTGVQAESTVTGLVTDLAAGLARANHTGTQAESTITNLVTDLAARALDSAVVHQAGNETVNGTKSFTDARVPITPTLADQAASKSYVDANAGTGGGGGSTTVPVLQKNASFTFAAGDAGAILECNSSSPLVVTLPALAAAPTMPLDAMSEIVQVGTGQVSVVAGSGVTLRIPPSPSGPKTRGRWAPLSVRRRNVAAATLSTTNLIGRYKADSVTGTTDLAAVSAWPESSGAGLPNAVQATAANQPKLRIGGFNGHKAVEFDGVNDFLSLSGSALALAQNKANLLVFIEFKLPAAAVTTGPHTALGLSNGLAAASHRLAISSHIATSLVPSMGGRRLDADAFGSVAGTTPLTTAQQGILTAQYNWAARGLTLFVDGTQVATTATFQTAGNTSNTASLAGVIGANSAATAEWFLGQIAEIMIFETNDTTGTVRANVHGYLYNTYGGTNPPADFTGVPDEWLLSGDSTA